MNPVVPNFTYVSAAGTGILGAIQIGIQIVMALAFLYFLYSVYEFITAKSDDKKKEAKGKLVYGLVALFVMASAWGIVKIIQNVTGATDNGPVQAVCPPGMALTPVLINGVPSKICR